MNFDADKKTISTLLSSKKYMKYRASSVNFLGKKHS